MDIERAKHVLMVDKQRRELVGRKELLEQINFDDLVIKANIFVDGYVAALKVEGNTEAALLILREIQN